MNADDETEFCAMGGAHLYRPLKENYAKLALEQTSGNYRRYEDDITYTMLYCERCGDCKEVISSDGRARGTKP